MAAHNVPIYEVEYLSTTYGELCSKEEQIVIVTIRPDPESFCPINMALSCRQTARLVDDLQRALKRATACLLLLTLIGLSGCSSKVEVERETTASPTAEQPSERWKTAVAVDLANGQPLLTTDGKPVGISSDANVVFVGNCIHRHVHIHINKGDAKAERLAIELLEELRREDCESYRCR